MFSRVLKFVGSLSLIGLLLLSASCRNKTSTGPDNPNPPGDETFRLVFDAPDTIRYGTYTTIVVRLFKGTGMAINDTLLLAVDSAPGYLHDYLVIPQSDTINVNGGCGANPCVRYRCDDTTQAKDFVMGYAISNGDTVATQSIGFFLGH